MNFYSIIYLVGNKASKEKISIGLLASSDQRPTLEYSEKKLKKALALIEGDIDSNIKNLLDSYKKKVEHYNAENKDSLLIESKSESWPFNFSRVNYLSRSADGIIEFSKPKFPSENLNERKFKNLFRLLIDSEYLKRESHLIDENRVRFKNKIDDLKNSEIVKDRADINFSLDNNVLSTIYDKARVDLLSCNGRILSGNGIDFSMNESTIEKKLYLFRALSEGMKKFSHENDLNREPRNILFFNRVDEASKGRILDSVHNDKDKPFELLEVDELEKVEEELESSNYHKFSERFL